MATGIEVGLSETQRQIVDLTREFARTRIEPQAADWDRTKHFARDVIDELGRLGFLGMTVPEEYGGMGLDTITYLLALEELAAADASVAVTVGVHSAIPATMLLRHGTAAQKERWLRPMAGGERLCGFALSEPDAGSDAASLRTRAVRDGDHWVLSGVVVAVLAASAAPDSGRAQAPPTREQVLAALARATPQHPADFTGMDLSGLDLAGIDFKRANLTNCRLVRTNLAKAQLSSVTLTDAVATEADFTAANLDVAVAYRVDLRRAVLRDASVFAVILYDADLSDADLSGARR